MAPQVTPNRDVRSLLKGEKRKILENVDILLGGGADASSANEVWRKIKARAEELGATCGFTTKPSVTHVVCLSADCQQVRKSVCGIRNTDYKACMNREQLRARAGEMGSGRQQADRSPRLDLPLTSAVASDGGEAIQYSVMVERKKNTHMHQERERERESLRSFISTFYIYRIISMTPCVVARVYPRSSAQGV